MKNAKNSPDYVLNHNYGYGKNKKRLKKLKLRNMDDFVVYVDDAVLNAFDASYSNNVLVFNSDKSKCKIIYG